MSVRHWPFLALYCTVNSLYGYTVDKFFERFPSLQLRRQAALACPPGGLICIAVSKRRPTNVVWPGVASTLARHTGVLKLPEVTPSDTGRGTVSGQYGCDVIWNTGCVFISRCSFDFREAYRVGVLTVLRFYKIIFRSFGSIFTLFSYACFYKQKLLISISTFIDLTEKLK